MIYKAQEDVLNARHNEKHSEKCSKSIIRLISDFWSLLLVENTTNLQQITDVVCENVVLFPYDSQSFDDIQIARDRPNKRISVQ